MNKLINYCLYNTMKYRVLPFRYYFSLHLCHSFLSLFFPVFVTLFPFYHHSPLSPYVILVLFFSFWFFILCHFLSLCHFSSLLLLPSSHIPLLHHSPLFFAMFHFFPFAQSFFLKFLILKKKKTFFFLFLLKNFFTPSHY